MIINKDYFDNSVFFDEKFFMYLENVDLCFRAKKDNGRLLIVTNSKIPLNIFITNMPTNWYLLLESSDLNNNVIEFISLLFLFIYY